jgi:hypothetical protein
VETYVILRRRAWRTGAGAREAIGRARAESERMSEEVTWIRSYILDESDRTTGTVCVLQASNPEAIRRHAIAADLPVDEIAKVAETKIVRPDPMPAATEKEESRC